MEAARKRLEALLLQLQHATAIADHTIAEVKAALQEMDDARPAPGGGPARVARSRKRPARDRATRKP